MKKKFIELRGTHRFNPNQRGINLQYGAPQTKLLLVGGEQLTDAELVVYTYMMISGYEGNRIKYKGTVSNISSDTTISERSTQRAIKSLQKKKLIKRVKNKNEAWFIVKASRGTKSIMVLKMFLMSREIPLNIKAFVLRLAALREEDGTLNSIDKVTTTNTIGIKRKSLETIQKVIPELDTEWLYSKDGVIYVNFTALNDYLIATTIEELSELRSSVSMKTKSNYRKDKLLGKRITNKGLNLITITEELRQQGYDVSKIEHNIKNHRLTRAESLIKKLQDNEENS